MPSQSMDIEMPQKAVECLWTRGKRYKVIYGGRGSAKSWSVARYIILEAYYRKIRILCIREIQSSIKDSVHKLLSDQIDQMGLSRAFTIQRDTITSHAGAEFIFKGLSHNINEVKSTEGLDICWVEEAEAVAEESWRVLIPTVRKEGSEIIITFNPEDEKSATYTRFVEVEGRKVERDDTITTKMNFDDNKFFSDTLRSEMEYDKRVDQEKYEHIWLGMPKKYGNACIFKGKIEVVDFETPEGVQFYFGADFGFSQDPTCLIRGWIKEHKLYLDYEAYGIGVEIEELPAFFGTVPDVKRWRIIADSARPETISYLRSKGFCIDGAAKGKGSVEDGIQFLRSFEKIVIHPRCKSSISDLQNYKWKTDRITGAILPIPDHSSSHTPDALRYMLEDYIKAEVPMVTFL